MIRIAICDNEQEFLTQLDSTLTQWSTPPARISTECFDNGDALISAHRNSHFDIILLDVVMPIFGGIETAQEIRKFDKNVKIVFLTSSPEFAVDSYSVKASNYLLKPVSTHKLFICIDELYEEIKDEDKHILIRQSGTYHNVPINNIEFLEAQNKAVKFSLADGGQIISSEKLYICEEKLLTESNFFKCHRSYIVNLHHISSYSSKEIVMRSGTRIPISRNVQKEFETTYFSVIFGEAGGNK